jgi:O-antigen ligase
MLDTSRLPKRHVVSWWRLMLVAGLLLVVSGYALVRVQVEPLWLILGALCTLVAQFLIRKVPVLLMVAMIYVGTLKSRAAEGVSPTDPTLIAAGLLYVAVALQILLSASGHATYRLKGLFAGQIAGIVTCCFLFTLIAFSVTYSPAQELGQHKVLRLFVFDLPLVLIPLILLRTNRDVRQMLLLCMGASLFLSLRAVYRTMHPTAEMLLGQQDPTEIGEGLLMGVAALMSLYYPYREKRWLHYGMIGLVVVFTFGIMASVSRSAMLSFLAVAIGSLIFLRQKAALVCRDTMLMSVVGIVIITPVSIMILWQLPSTHAKVTQKAAELSAMLRGVSPPGTAGQRYSFSESAWNAFLEKPLLGWGASGWSTLWHLSDERVLKYPHNFVLEIAAEQGLAGVALLAIVLFVIARKSMAILRDPQRRFLFILPVVVFCLLGNAVTGQVDDRAMWFFFGTMFALNRMLDESFRHVPPTARIA